MASCAPVDAPDGTPARPRDPSARTTSTSTVGLPRLSRISRPIMSTMAVMIAPGLRGASSRSALWLSARWGAKSGGRCQPNLWPECRDRLDLALIGQFVARDLFEHVDKLVALFARQALVEH